MSTKMKALFFTAAFAALLPAIPASADIRTGKLICTVAAGTGYVVISEKALTCRYDSVDGRHEYYVGSINKYGIDLGYTIGGTLIWAVFEPAIRTGGLTGVYSGGTSEFTLGVGIGASALIGGGDGGVTLQPVSINAQAGLNVAAAVAGMSLTQIAPPPVDVAPVRRHRRHHQG